MESWARGVSRVGEIASGSDGKSMVEDRLRFALGGAPER
jgi:hypothetical protein